MGQAQINVRTRACSGTFIARTKQAALTHNVRGKELNKFLALVEMSVSSLRAVIAAGHNASQRSRVGIGMNTSAKG